MSIESTISTLHKERLLTDYAPHSPQFRRLTICLLTVCSCGGVIPALNAGEAQLYAMLAPFHGIAPWVQVVGLADAFDALLHPRVYKPAFPLGQAFEMIVSGACGAFHPDLLACFSRNIDFIYYMAYARTRKEQP